MKKLLTKAAAYFSKMSRRQTWRVVVGCLACAVVFITTYALILPAITLENSKYEPDGHTHTEDCYQIVKTDPVTELDCPWINHTHTKECYDADGNLICDYRADYVVHIHDEYCYDADGNLVCSLPEIEGHQHDDSCYNDEGSLICGIEEEEGHQHDDKCIKIIREASEEKILDCPYANSVPETEDEGDSGSADEQSEGTQEISGSEEPTNDEDENAENENANDAEDPADSEGENTNDAEDPADSESEDTENENANAVENPADSEDENTEDEGEDNGESSVIYSGENDSVSVEVILEEENTVPEDAVVRITKVTPENEDYDYALLKEQAENTVGEEAASQIDFYDISFYTAEGEYIPVTDTAKVTLRFKEEGNLAEAEEITVLHYKKDAEEPSCAENIEKESNDDQTWLSFQTAGFSVFGITPLSSGEELSPQASGDDVTDLDEKTFAIVNEVNNAAYALTATNTTVNNVGGLAAQEVTVTEDEEKGSQIIGLVTPWTFHLQEDGTYRISTTVTDSDGTESIKYLRLYETPYDSSNDGRGSLTLTDEENASSIHVTETDDGSVNLWMENSDIENNSYINSDSETHNFWCFYNGTGDYSKHLLCEIVEPEIPDYTGYWAIVNVSDNINTTSTSTLAGVLMEAEGIGDSESANRKGTEVTVDVVKSAATVRSYNTDVTQWYFKKQEDGTYYISNTVTDENGVTTPQYLNIGDSEGNPVTLSTIPMPITVTMGAGDYAGKVRLTNSAGMAVNLYGGSASSGFGTWSDTGGYEWQTLCKVNRGKDVVKETANHPSSVINLFDYWITGQDSSDKETGVPENLNLGINDGHDLKFVNQNGLTDYNGWTESARCYTGIVENNLGTDGYPVLAVGSGESLNYLFDPKTENNYKKVYQRTSGLLQTDSQGYYYYNSAWNFAELKSGSKNEFTLYDTWGVYSGGASGIKGQFFPFNKMENVMNATSTSEQMNHYFGLTLTTRFVQQYSGHTNSSRKTKTVFNFSGDDDVWIFIDNVLVADLGGIHDKASVSIDFAAGSVTINGGNAATGSVKYLKDLFTTAGKTLEDSDWSGNTFADNSYHTLKFFYLERGNTDSNLYLQYNLTEIPTTGIYKVNQYGDVLGGAKFAVYRSDEHYNVTDDTPVYEGTTDELGQMIFADEDGMPYTLTELKDKFGEHFVLRETEAPENYSLVSDDIHLYIESGMLLCANTYDSGVYSSPTLLVTAPNELKTVKNETIDYYDIGNLDAGTSKGTLFAVVLKYLGDGASGFEQQSNWAPVYGNNEKGYTVCDVNGNTADDFIAAAIEAAKAQSSSEYGNTKVCFDVAANGMQLEIKNLPGDITTYYYVLGDNKNKTQYTVAYYYTTASDLSEATSNNTVRINSEDSQYKFDRVFGATIEVPNLINRLFAQKVNEQDELINGATFALYQVEEIGSKIYYKTDNGLVYLEPDGDDDGKGTAVFQGGETEYRYEVCTDGTIKILNADGNETGYVIQPYKTAMTLPFNSEDNTAHEEGTASFVGLADGNYYLREVNVPKGYKLNGEEVMVKVAENAVYANAGVEDDGITVARGPGYLVYTLGRFASQGDVDNTLSWIYEQMRISGESHTFTAYDEDQWKNWHYLKENVSSETVTTREDGCKIYLAYDPYAEGGDSGKAASDNAALFNYKVNEDKYRIELNYSEEQIKEVRRRLYTTVGWSYYEIYQDYDYGKDHSEGANYYQILDNRQPQEIANLFSRSTYVRVTDEKENGRLMIHKTVVNAPENNTDTYEFTVTLKNAAGAALSGSYPYKVYNSKDLEGTTSTDEITPQNEDMIQSSGTISLKADQVIVIEDIPAGTIYSVTESDSDDYSTTSIRDKNKPAVGDGTGEQEFDNEVTGTLYWSVTEGDNGEEITDTTSTVDFTNTYPSDFTLYKTDGSNGGVKLSGAAFVLYQTDEEGRKLYYANQSDNLSDGDSAKTEWKALATGEKEDDYALATNEEGTLSFYGLYDGLYYLKEIKAPSGYRLLKDEITLTVTDGKLTGRGTEGDSVTIGDDGLSLTVSNSAGYELPNTGGGGTWPYLAGGILLMAGSIIYMVSWRRRREYL